MNIEHWTLIVEYYLSIEFLYFLVHGYRMLAVYRTSYCDYTKTLSKQH